MKRLLAILAGIITIALPTSSALAYSLQNPAPGFGPDQYQNLIPDTQFTSVDMPESAITAFLKKQGIWSTRSGGVSWLADYQIPEYQTVPYKYASNGTCNWGTVSVRQYNDAGNEPLFGMTAANLIAQKSQQKGIAAEVLLATLEKESSAISRTTPQSDATQMWVLGYGWNDSMAACAYDQATSQAQAIAYGGVGQQIAYAMNWFLVRYGQYASTFSNTFTTVDGASISAKGRGTRALYAYTPYVYNGNYNFWLFTNQWFTPPIYKPTGLAINTTTGTVYVIDEGQRWAVTGAGFQAWNFDWSDVHPITSDELALPSGGSTWTQLVLGSDGTIYYIENGKKRPLTSARLMDRYHLSWSDVQPKSDTILNRVPYGLPMHELLLPVTGDGTVYLATAGTLYPVSGTMYNDSWKFDWADTARVPGYVTYNLPKGPLITNLVLKDGGDGTVFFIDAGNSYAVSGAMAQAWGFDLSTIRTVGPALVEEKPYQGLLTNLARQIDGDGTVYLIQGKKKYPMSGSYFRAHGYSFSDIRTISPMEMNLLSDGNTLR